MGIVAKIEINISPIASDPDIAAIASIPENQGLIQGDWLILPQWPGWYIPQPLTYETEIYTTPQTARASYGDRFYKFVAKTEGARAGAIYRILLALPNPVTLRDYCNRGGGGTLGGTHPWIYKERSGKLTIEGPVDPMNSNGITRYVEGCELKFWEA
ncbi:MAG: hypothetical protein J7647_32245 [Cyanobacteria bacterium SBLK]|nr:hypothetical protein [Cyanobacteria bacterium SBLK]